MTLPVQSREYHQVRPGDDQWQGLARGVRTKNAKRTAVLIAASIALALIFAVPFAHCQYVPIRAFLSDDSGTAGRTSFLHFQLMGCGTYTPAIAGTLAIAQTAIDFRPNQNDGSVTGQVVGNDFITCNGWKTTYYHVTVMKDQYNALGAGQDYLICSTSACYPQGGTWDISAAPLLVKWAIQIQDNGQLESIANGIGPNSIQMRDQVAPVSWQLIVDPFGFLDQQLASTTAPITQFTMRSNGTGLPFYLAIINGRLESFQVQSGAVN